MSIRIMLCFYGIFLLSISPSLAITEAYTITLALWAQGTLQCTSRNEEAQASTATQPNPLGEAAAERGLTGSTLHAWSMLLP